jgi:hypothetical protein
LESSNAALIVSINENKRTSDQLTVISDELYQSESCVKQHIRNYNALATKLARLEGNVAKSQPFIVNKLTREALFSDSITVSKESFFRDTENTDLGHTIFTRVAYTAKDLRFRILEFHGDKIKLSAALFDKRPDFMNRYLIHMGGDLYLDCTTCALSGACRASKCNDPRNLFNKISPQIKAVGNVDLYRDTINFRAWLVVKQPLCPGTELFLSYGLKFKIPSCELFIDRSVF